LFFYEFHICVIISSLFLGLFIKSCYFEQFFRIVFTQSAYLFVQDLHLVFLSILYDFYSLRLTMLHLDIQTINASRMLILEILQIFLQKLDLIFQLLFFNFANIHYSLELSFKLRNAIAAFSVSLLHYFELFAIGLYR
jgi:hypothetical protein